MASEQSGWKGAEVKFYLSSLFVLLGLLAAGYHPSAAWDSPGGQLGLICGLSLALVLMGAGYAAIQWAMARSQTIFMTVFAVGFVARLVLFIACFFLYVKIVGDGKITFAVSFGVGYMALTIVEFFSLKKVKVANKE